MTTPQALDTLIAQLATEHLFIDTLEVRNSDRLDFHEVSVWGVKQALLAAFEAGQQAARQPGPRTRKAAPQAQ